MDLDTNTTTAALISELTTTGLAPKEVKGTHHLVIPASAHHINITDLVNKAAPTPTRKTATLALGDVESLLAYCADQKAAASAYIYADADSRTLTAVFNDNKGKDAGWRDHRATFTALLTPEARKWIDKNKHQFGQEEFAEFIEDNMADLQGDEAQTLLTVATTIQASNGITFSGKKVLQSGQTQLTYNENIEARAGADGSVTIPKHFQLGMKLFKGADKADLLLARLKFRMHGQSIKFFYELDRHEKVIETAFAEYVQMVREKSGYTVLTGKA